MSMSSTSSASLARSLVDSPFATDCKVLPAICSVSSQISKEALEIFVHTSIFTIRSGRVMKFFKRSIEDHKVAAFVRFLEFPSFHWFSPGGTFPAGRHGPGGVYSTENTDVQRMQQCSRLQTVRISLEVTHNFWDKDLKEYVVACHTVQQLLDRYYLGKIVACASLQRFTLDLTNRLGSDAVNKKDGDTFGYAEELAQVSRNRMGARMERKFKQKFKRDAKEKARKVLEHAEKAKAEGKPVKAVKPVDAEQAMKDLERATAKERLTVVTTVHYNK